MSDVLNLTDYGFSATDDYTHVIVYGYMRIPSNSFYGNLTHSMPYVSVEITSITMKYIGDHFILHRGSHQ